MTTTPRRNQLLAILLCATPLLVAAFSPRAEVTLSSLEVAKMRVQPGAGRGNQGTVAQRNKSIDGNPISIGGKQFVDGVGTRATSVLFVNLNGGSETFTAMVGADDNPPPPPAAGAAPTQPPPPTPIVFRVLGDSRVLHISKPVVRGDAPEPLSVDVRGIKTLVLQVKPVEGTRAVAANWADAKFTSSGATPVAIDIPVEPRTILTPKAGPAPKINGPSLTGVTPGHDVLYRIPVTGTRPMTFSVSKLPNGLTLDAKTGIIRGKIATRGRYPVTFTAKNSVGTATKNFTFVAEGLLSLTPAMGWNSWNVYGRAISDSLARAAADAMISKGLADHGWSYVNLDDGWERSARAADSVRPADPLYEGPVRAEDGTMLTNKKFPDMKALGDYIHDKGLKFGIYSGPGPTTCQRLEASWQHELQDFQTFAGWGVDYLKYDWCGYSSVLAPGETNQQLEVLKRPYRVAREALNKVARDIIYSLCQYGWGNVWEWGAEKGIEGNSWRTTGDITDTWESMNGIGFRQVGNSKHASPGHWNDPDMLVIGKVGWGPRLRDSRLTPNEQYIHITLWTLLASPLLLGNDLTQMDDFELNLVTNDEVLAVHQDPLGKAADRVSRTGELEVWSRPLADGSLAVGLFNRDEMDMNVSVKWSDLGITGKHVVRDLWRQKDLGSFDGEFGQVVPRHGALFVKIISSVIPSTARVITTKAQSEIPRFASDDEVPRCARDDIISCAVQTTPRTALIVEGGGLRGAFAAGALLALLERLGPDYFDAVYAVSSGVFTATYYVSNQPDEIERTWRDRVWGHQLVNYSGIVRGRPILQLDYLIGVFRGVERLDFDAVMRARSTLEYVLTDYQNGQPVYFDAKRPDLFDLMRASSALPRVYPIPVIIDGKPYYDGGQSDAIPIQRAIDRGAERIVVIRTRADSYQKKPRSRLMGAWLLASAPAARAEWLTLHERYNAAVAMIHNPPRGVQILSISPAILRVGRLTRSREPIIDAIEAGKVVAAERLAAASSFFGKADPSLRSG